jgi:hypothetical protein
MLKLIFIAIVFYPSLLLAKSGFKCDPAHPESAQLTNPKSAKDIVFIYYTNDLAINPGYDWSYRNFLTLLNKLKNAKGSELGDDDKAYLDTASSLIEYDMKRFHEVAAKQVDQVAKLGCGDRNSFRTGTVVISNHGMRSPHTYPKNVHEMDIRLSYCKPRKDSDQFERGEVRIPFGFSPAVLPKPLADHLYSQPMLTPSVLRSSLEIVRKLFDEERSQFVLWMKGIGDGDHVFRPPYDVDASKIEQIELWQKLLANKIPEIASGDVKLIREKARQLASQIRTSIEKDFPAAKHFIPAKKTDFPYLEKEVVLQQIIHNKFGTMQPPMLFPFVVWESDFSALGNSSHPSIKALASSQSMRLSNVGEVCTLEQSPESYEEIDFERLFMPLGVDRSKGFMPHFIDTMAK